jgi:hypothetical protein
MGVGAAGGQGLAGQAAQDDLSNLIMAWYHCGFFTARFMERHGQ